MLMDKNLQLIIEEWEKEFGVSATESRGRSA